MSDLITKLQRIKQTKKEIKDAINAKGSSCNTECFREYPDRILAIQGGGDEDLSYILELIGDGNLINGNNWQSIEEIIKLIGGDVSSVERQLQELIDMSNAVTGNNDDTLTESVESLVDSYGQSGGVDNEIARLYTKGEYTPLYHGTICEAGIYAPLGIMGEGIAGFYTKIEN